MGSRVYTRLLQSSFTHVPEGLTVDLLMDEDLWSWNVALVRPIFYEDGAISGASHPVGNPKRMVWWAQRQVSLDYEIKV
jgi:hypothetical protein